METTVHNTTCRSCETMADIGQTKLTNMKGAV